MEAARDRGRPLKQKSMRGAFAALLACAALGIPARGRGAQAPADPWPRQFKSGNATILVYQPQVESWIGNTITFRSAIAIRKPDPKDDVFGVIFAKARTQVDKASRIVLLEDVAVTKRDFPGAPDNGLLYLISLKTQLGPSQRTIALDRLEASLAASGAGRPPGGRRSPTTRRGSSSAGRRRCWWRSTVRPRCGRSRTPLQRVINTRTLVLANEDGTAFLPASRGRGWLSAPALDGPWEPAEAPPEGLEAAAASLAAAGDRRPADGRQARLHPRSTSARRPPALIVFEGEPAFDADPGHDPRAALRTQRAKCSSTRRATSISSCSRAAGSRAGARRARGPACRVRSFPRTSGRSPPIRRPPGFSPRSPERRRRMRPCSPTPSLRPPSSAASAGPRSLPGSTERRRRRRSKAPRSGTSSTRPRRSSRSIRETSTPCRTASGSTPPRWPGPGSSRPPLPDAIATIPAELSAVLRHPRPHLWRDHRLRLRGLHARLPRIHRHPGRRRGRTAPATSTRPGSDRPGIPSLQPTRPGEAVGPRPTAISTAPTARASAPRSAAAFSSGGGRNPVTPTPETGKSSPYGRSRPSNDVYVDKEGHIYSNASGHWQQHSADGWMDAAGDMDWAERKPGPVATARKRFSAVQPGPARRRDPDPGNSPR